MADARRLLADATGAFVDRTPIDWSALLSRVRTSPDCALFENLHALSAVRREAQPAASSATESSRAVAAAWFVVALGSIETLLLLGLLGRALLIGASIGARAPQLILALAFAASSVRLGVATFRDPRSVFLLATFTAGASIFTQSAARGLPAPWSLPVDPRLTGVWIDVFLPACLWQFALGFPRVLRFTRFDRFARPAVAALWMLGALLFVFNIVVTRLDINPGVFAYLLPDHPSYLCWRLFSLLLTGALFAVLARTRRAPLRERRKVARLARAIGVGLGPFLLFGVVRTAVPVVDAWFRASGSWGAASLYGLIMAALAATPVLSTAAVLADRPFERQAVAGLRSGWLGMLASRISHTAAHQDRCLARAIERLSRARGTREVIAGLSNEIAALFGVKTVEVLLREENGGAVHWSNATAVLPSNGALAVLMREAAEPLDVSPSGALLALLPHEDRAWVAANAVHLIAPVKRRDGGIAAVVAIGAKTNGTTFDRRDRWLTLALIAAAVATFDDDGRAKKSSGDRGLRSAPAAASGEVAFECPLCGIVGPCAPLPCRCGRDATLAALPHWVAEKFRVERRVGSGGMGVVYLARDTALDRDVALKTLPNLRPHSVERLRDEARAMAALNHESLATLYGLEIWRGTPILVVEYFPKGTLATRLSLAPLSPGETVALGVRLAQALAYMHARAVQHRDLKPRNIAFTAAGEVKLLDFGLATLSSRAGGDDERSHDGGIMSEPFVGTPAYAPPEAFLGVRSWPNVDRWALAVVMLEAASGINPFAAAYPGATRRVATSVEVSGLCSPRLRATPELRVFLERALAPSPAHRFHTSDDFLAALEGVADALAVRVGH